MGSLKWISPVPNRRPHPSEEVLQLCLRDRMFTSTDPFQDVKLNFEIGFVTYLFNLLTTGYVSL
jgi:hypothetical protein